MCFLYSAQVVARDRAQRAARQRRLEQVGRVAGAGRAAGADQRVGLVDEQDDRLRRRLHFVDHLAQAVLELALHAGAGLQQADVERAQLTRPSAAAARRRARCAARSLRPPRSCRRRPRRSGSGCSGAAASGCRRSGGSPRRGRRSDRSRRCARCSVRSTVKRFERLLLAHRRRRDGAAGFARRRAASPLPSLARCPSSGEPDEQLGEVVGQVLELDRVELLRDRRAARCAGASSSACRRSGSRCAPACRRTSACRRPSRARPRPRSASDRSVIELAPRGRRSSDGGQVARQRRGVELVVLDDAVQVRVLRLQDLVQPVQRARRRGCRAACRTRWRLRSPCSASGLSLPNKAVATDLEPWRSPVFRRSRHDGVAGCRRRSLRSRPRCASSRRPSQA